MTVLEQADALIEKAEAELLAVYAAHPGFADEETFEKVFDMLRKLASRTQPYGLPVH